MRSIVFRAWDKKKKELHLVLNIDWLNRLVDLDKGLIERDFEDVVLEQYTGLKDKNSKEIYEGDIIKIHTHYIFYGTDVDDWDDEYALVEWSEEYGGFFIYGETPLWEVLFEGRPKDGFYHNYPEVVGNVHENPELLEEISNE